MNLDDHYLMLSNFIIVFFIHKYILTGDFSFAINQDYTPITSGVTFIYWNKLGLHNSLRFMEEKPTFLQITLALI